MSVNESLKKYREMRNFDVTPEPRGASRTSVSKEHKPIFVVQKYHASHLHYDLRLEMAGVLKSWAVPKGPSMDPKTKRLAMPTEDHPIEYAEFEGVIPDQEYGGGRMIVWDRGTYELETGSEALQSYEAGKLRFRLDGQKLNGLFSMYRLPDSGPRKGWLVTKIKDESARPGSDIAAEQPKSILSGRDVDKAE